MKNKLLLMCCVVMPFLVRGMQSDATYDSGSLLPMRSAYSTNFKSRTTMPKAGHITVKNYTITDLKIIIRDGLGKILTVPASSSQVVLAGSKGRTKIPYTVGTTLPLNVRVLDDQNSVLWCGEIANANSLLDNDEWRIEGSLENGIRIERTTQSSTQERREVEQQTIPLQ